MIYSGAGLRPALCISGLSRAGLNPPLPVSSSGTILRESSRDPHAQSHSSGMLVKPMRVGAVVLKSWMPPK